jgi:predicted nucleic acid-binding protein
MSYLLDTGILLRLADDKDQLHATVEAAVGILGSQRQALIVTVQNFAEFWNLATRPVANNGLAFSPDSVSKLYENTIEPLCAIFTETASLHDKLKELLLKYSVVGKQVHDVRLVAMMLTWQVDTILTLNERNFRRFEPEGIVVITPEVIIAAGP